MTSLDNEMEHPQELPQHSLTTWARIYIHGCIVLAVIVAAAYIVSQLVPLFGFVGSPALATVLSILTVIVAPPVIGSVVLFGVLPLLGRHAAWRGREAWDDRLYSELTQAKSKTRVVIVRWPDENVRTMGVLTATLDRDDNGQQMAAVYVPTAPYTRYGYIRIVPSDALELTDWTLKEWQMFQLSFGSMGPKRFRDTPLDDD